MNGLTTDIETGDLLVEHGAAVVADSDGQTVEAVLLAQRGEFKECPLIGAAVRQLLGGCKDVFWPQETKKMIKAAGVEVNRVKVDADGTVNIT
ncbi:hypothetical protein [Prevotella merdae]|jgi:hypothetical protein|uniref:hypothetical protein n=1 Tax=Prevotella merdae TaxID=2079531 RepID=UPI00356629A7